MNLSGGAPRSVYEYLSVLKNDGNSITVLFNEKDQKLSALYKNSFDDFVPTVYGYDLLLKSRVKDLYFLLKKEYNYLKREPPDLVLVLGHFNAFFYTCFCNSLNIPAITIIAGGDLTEGVHLLEGCPCDHIICFSKENRDVLQKCIDDERITVISNRIQLKTVFDDAENHYNLSADESVNVLFTSRVDKDKLDSITSFISLADKIANNNQKINISVAGNGDCFGKLKDYVDSIDNPCLSIELKGHVNDLVPEFKKAHIVIGKGRSVMEPIMMNRIGCVIGNDGKIEVCTTDNFDNLYHYNFSGRNLNCDDPKAVLEGLIDSITSGSFNTDEMLSVADITRKHYSSEYLADKFYYVLDNMKCEKRRKKRVSVLWLVLKLIWIKTLIKIRRRKTK